MSDVSLDPLLFLRDLGTRVIYCFLSLQLHMQLLMQTAVAYSGEKQLKGLSFRVFQLEQLEADQRLIRKKLGVDDRLIERMRYK